MKTFIIVGKDIDEGTVWYWSNQHGWTSNDEQATQFTETERATFGLPEADDVEAIEWREVR